MQNAMQNLIKKVYRDFGKTKRIEKDYVKESASLEIRKIIALQKKASISPANISYEEAGFKAETLTSIMVQNQIAAGA
jgi:hypothetical protein